MKIAERIANLGTETAFAVSLAANAWASQGNKIYPFHLGDLNMPTAPHIVDALNKAIADGKTGYCPAAGIPQLREALAEDVSARRNLNFTPENVIVQPGGKPVITKFIQSLINPGDEVLYPNPGYPIYESQIEYFNGVAKPYRYYPSPSGFSIDIDQIKSLITPKTRAIIYNDLQNPNGAESTDEEREALAKIAIENNLYVLSDEAYFEMRFSGKSKSIAQLPGMLERTVILYTFSKKFAMTGWRLGAAIAPPEVAAIISKLNTNDESCTSHFTQYAGVEAIRGDQSFLPVMLDTLKDRRDTALNYLREIDGIDVHQPEAGFYLFPEVSKLMQRKGFKDVTELMEESLHETGVSFCTRLHFGRPQPNEELQYIRLAFSGINKEEIAEGLAKFRDWLS
ncbi:MAG: pyridoxal phosphate-dependent aminotransferase [Candidatus Nanopelagicales bacterium]